MAAAKAPNSINSRIAGLSLAAKAGKAKNRPLRAGSQPFVRDRFPAGLNRKLRDESSRAANFESSLRRLNDAELSNTVFNAVQAILPINSPSYAMMDELMSRFCLHTGVVFSAKGFVHSASSSK